MNKYRAIYKSKYFREHNPWYVRLWKIPCKYWTRIVRDYTRLPFVAIRNYFLVQRFPFLRPSCGWSVDMEYWHKDYQYHYEETWLDCLPHGWRKNFAMDLCKDLQHEIEQSHLSDYKVHQVKEKWGELCWYDEGGNKYTRAIIEKYEKRSAEICIACGRPAEYMTRSWIGYYCGKCARKFKDFGTDNVVEIKKDYA